MACKASVKAAERAASRGLVVVRSAAIALNPVAHPLVRVRKDVTRHRLGVQLTLLLLTACDSATIVTAASTHRGFESSSILASLSSGHKTQRPNCTGRSRQKRIDHIQSQTEWNVDGCVPRSMRLRPSCMYVCRIFGWSCGGGDNSISRAQCADARSCNHHHEPGSS